jgi:hypothetical protein
MIVFSSHGRARSVDSVDHAGAEAKSAPPAEETVNPA